MQVLKVHIDICKIFGDTNDDPDSILEQFDINEDGKIDFEEFKLILEAAERKKEKSPTQK